MQVKLTTCRISGVRSDMLKSTVSLTITTDLDQQLMEALRVLRTWGTDNSFIDVVLSEQQMRLPFVEKKTMSVRVSGMERSVDIDPDAAREAVERLATEPEPGAEGGYKIPEDFTQAEEEAGSGRSFAEMKGEFREYREGEREALLDVHDDLLQQENESAAEQLRQEAGTEGGYLVPDSATAEKLKQVAQELKEELEALEPVEDVPRGHGELGLERSRDTLEAMED